MKRRGLYDDPKRNETAFGNIVEVPVPPLGFGAALDTITVFHMQLGIQPRRGHGRYREPTHYVRWCFASPLHASAFQALFGGVLVET